MNSEQIWIRTNWPLPVEQELRSFGYPAIYTPDIDVEYFPHTKPRVHWSGSETAKNKNLAFTGDFNNNIGSATKKRLAHRNKGSC